MKRLLTLLLCLTMLVSMAALPATSLAEETVELPGGYELYGTGERVNSIKLAPFGVAVLSKLTKI